MSPTAKPRNARPQAAGPSPASQVRRKRLHREYAGRLLGAVLALVALIDGLSYTSLRLTASVPILIFVVVCASFLGGLVDGLIAAGVTVWYYAYDLSVTGTVFPDGAGFDRAYSGPLPGAIQRLQSADHWPGAGLALAMVQRIVQRHGGRIWTEARPDGATFSCTLGEFPGPRAASA